jgi:hypothetical protein
MIPGPDRLDRVWSEIVGSILELSTSTAPFALQCLLRDKKKQTCASNAVASKGLDTIRHAPDFIIQPGMLRRIQL